MYPLVHFGRIVSREKPTGGYLAYTGKLGNTQESAIFYVRQHPKVDTVSLSVASRLFSPLKDTIAECSLGTAAFAPAPSSFLEGFFRRWAFGDSALPPRLNLEQYPPGCDETLQAELSEDFQQIVTELSHSPDLEKLVQRAPRKSFWRWINEPTRDCFEVLPIHGMGGDH